MNKSYSVNKKTMASFSARMNVSDAQQTEMTHYNHS